MSRTLHRTCLLLVTVIPWMVAPTVRANACPDTLFGGRASTCHSTIAWTYDRSAGVFASGGQAPSMVSQGVQYHLEYRSRCERGANCTAALTCAPGGYRYNVALHTMFPDGTWNALPSSFDTICVYPDRSVPVADVTAAAHEELRRRIPAPSINSAPSGKTLVNIITIYHTNDPGPQRVTTTLPVPGSISATPSYAWDFGDGLSASGAGTAYEDPDDPNRLPGKYLGPTWRTAGVKHVTLTVTWRVVFQLDGESVTLAPIVMTAHEEKTVATARGVLVTR